MRELKGSGKVDNGKKMYDFWNHFCCKNFWSISSKWFYTTVPNFYIFFRLGNCNNFWFWYHCSKNHVQKENGKRNKIYFNVITLPDKILMVGVSDVTQCYIWTPTVRPMTQSLLSKHTKIQIFSQKIKFMNILLMENKCLSWVERWYHSLCTYSKFHGSAFLIGAISVVSLCYSLPDMFCQCLEAVLAGIFGSAASF